MVDFSAMNIRQGFAILWRHLTTAMIVLTAVTGGAIWLVQPRAEDWVQRQVSAKAAAIVSQSLQVVQSDVKSVQNDVADLKRLQLDQAAKDASTKTLIDTLTEQQQEMRGDIKEILRTMSRR